MVRLKSANASASTKMQIVSRSACALCNVNHEIWRAADGYRINREPLIQQQDQERRESWEHKKPFDPVSQTGLPFHYQDQVMAQEMQIVPLDWAHTGVNYDSR